MKKSLLSVFLIGLLVTTGVSVNLNKVIEEDDFIFSETDTYEKATLAKVKKNTPFYKSDYIDSFSDEEKLYVSQMGSQFKYSDDGKKCAIRFVAAINADYDIETEQYFINKNYGFNIQMKGKDIDTAYCVEVGTYYEKIYADNVLIDTKTFLNDNLTEYNIFITYSIYDIPVTYLSSLHFDVTPYAYEDNTYYRGESAMTSLYLADINKDTIINGDFETGDMTGWTNYDLNYNLVSETEDKFGGVADLEIFWEDNNRRMLKEGTYFYLGDANGTEIKTGMIASTVFKVKELGVSLLLGAAANFENTNVKIIECNADGSFNAESRILATFTNNYFVDPYLALSLVYQSTLLPEDALGTYARVVIYDNATGGFGFVNLDDVRVNQTAAQLLVSKEVWLETHREAYQGGAALAVSLVDKYSVVNGDFETGDLYGWTILTEGMTGGVSGATSYWAESLPYNQHGLFHLNGWDTGIGESEGWAIRSSNFILGGSGFISVKMGGNAARFKVFKADGTLIGYYSQTRFNDANFPYIANGGSWADMATYVADLSQYIGEELYIELHDEVISGGWAHAWFDNVVTYYQTVPVLSDLADEVMDGNNSNMVTIEAVMAVNLVA